MLLTLVVCMGGGANMEMMVQGKIKTDKVEGKGEGCIKKLG